MRQEELNEIIENGMPQWRKDQIHNEKTEQEIYDSGYKAGYKAGVKSMEDIWRS